MYDCSSMHFRSQKEKNKKRNTRTSNRTCILGPGVPVGVEMRAGGSLVVKTCVWGASQDQNALLGGRR